MCLLIHNNKINHIYKKRSIWKNSNYRKFKNWDRVHMIKNINIIHKKKKSKKEIRKLIVLVKFQRTFKLLNKML